jgi:TRAP-type C4-dicarboxylate transport system permease small subunit
VKKVIERFNALVLLCMFVITTITVIFRVFLKISASWSEDLAQYSFIFLAFIGSAAIMQDESHIKITVVVDRLGRGMQKIFRLVGRLLMLPFLIIFTLGAYDNVKFNWVVELSTVAWMKIGYMYLVVFISGVIMTFYVFLNLYFDLFGKKKGGAETGGAS